MYRMIHLESLIPETLPGVSLYVRHGEQYVMYKGSSHSFTRSDRDRLLDSNVKILYVRSGDISRYNQYVESNLSTLMNDESLGPLEKQHVLYQTSVNYVHEIFDRPAGAVKTGFDRCRNLMQHILNDVLTSEGVMTALCGLVDHNAYTYVHSVHVATYSIAMHTKLFDLECDELLDVGFGSLFHDYGKVYIPKQVLDKPGKLTASELTQLKQHPSDGYQTLKDLDIFSPVSLGIVKHHHEKENGCGYPDGLSSYGIARSSKITAIADVFSALTTNRCYRAAMPKEAALDIMYGEMDGSFNLEYLDVFRESVIS